MSGIAAVVFEDLARIILSRESPRPGRLWLLAIPVAGMIQVVARDVWDERRGRFKDEPTVGADETPVEGAVPE